MCCCIIENSETFLKKLRDGSLTPLGQVVLAGSSSRDSYRADVVEEYFAGLSEKGP